MRNTTQQKITSFVQALVQEFGEGAEVTRKQVLDFMEKNNMKKSTYYFFYFVHNAAKHRSSRGKYVVSMKKLEQTISEIQPMMKNIDESVLTVEERNNPAAILTAITKPTKKSPARSKDGKFIKKAKKKDVAELPAWFEEKYA